MDSLYLILATVLCVLVFLLSIALDQLVTGTFRGTVLTFLRVPGIVVHEFCHVLACLFTRAKIIEVVWYSPYDGSGRVVHGKPAIPVFGNFFIAFAPLFGVALLLTLLAGIFTRYFGLVIAAPPPFEISPSLIVLILFSSLEVITTNLIRQPNIWFLLYLYLTITLLTGLAPSGTDLLSRDVGISILIIAAFCYAVFHFGWTVPAMVIRMVSGQLIVVMGFGLVCEVIALLIMLPAAIVVRRLI
jgi:hypothetical protein